MSALRTTLGSYGFSRTVTGTEAAPSDFTVDSLRGDSQAFNMLKKGGGDETDANALMFAVSGTATDGQTCTVQFWGSADGGPVEHICDVDYVFGTAVKSTGVLWADTATETSYHTSSILKADSGNNHAVRVGFDATGFRYIKPYVTASTATDVTIQARFW